MLCEKEKEETKGAIDYAPYLLRQMHERIERNKTEGGNMSCHKHEQIAGSKVILHGKDFL